MGQKFLKSTKIYLKFHEKRKSILVLKDHRQFLKKPKKRIKKGQKSCSKSALNITQQNYVTA